MEKIVEEKTKNEKGIKIFFYAAWVLITIFYIANFWFMNYGVVHEIYNNPRSGIEYFTYYTYTLNDMGFIIFPIAGWLGITLVVLMVMEEKLREKSMSFMQRIWNSVSRRRASN